MRNIFSSKNLLVVIVILIPLVLIMSFIFPMKKEICQKDNFNTCVYSKNGVPLAFNRRNDNSNIACMMDSVTLSKVFKFIIYREDPEFFNQKEIFRYNLYKNFMGVSGRMFFGNGGGSTISQQALKNLSTSIFTKDNDKRTMISKLSEIFGALRLQQQFSNTEQLQLYINNIGLSTHAYRGDLASMQFFGRPLNELNDKELYLIARSVKSPKFGNVFFKDLKNLSTDSLNSLIKISYTNTIIKNGLSNNEELERILTMPVQFKQRKADASENRYLLDIIKPLEIKKPGSAFITTIDKKVADVVNNSFIEYGNIESESLKKGDSYLDANAVVIDMNTGEVIGINTIPLVVDENGYALNKNQFWASTPIGSLFKVILITDALDKNLISINQSLLDKFKGRIRNYNNKYLGDVTLRETIKKSLNTPLDNLTNRNLIVGETMTSMNSVFGINEKINPSQACLGQPILLNPVQVAQIYRAILKDGVVKKIKVVKNAKDTDVFPYKNVYDSENKEFKICSLKNSKLVRELLKSPLEEGGTLQKAGEVADGGALYGKSGTTANYEYGWTVLANDKYLVVVRLTYLGKKTPIPNNSGGLSAGVLAGLILKNLK